MPLYHIALFQTKDGSSQADAEEFLNAAKEMVGQIPGLSSVEGGKVLGSPAVSAAHTFGFDWAFVLKLEREQDLPVYEQHPAHQPLFELSRKAFGKMLLVDFPA